MTYGADASVVTRRKKYCGKHTAESKEDITQATRRRERYGKRAFGGRPPSRTRNSAAESATCANG